MSKRYNLLLVLAVILGITVSFLPNGCIWPFTTFSLGLALGICLILLMWPGENALITIFIIGFLLRALISIGLYIASFIRQINTTYLAYIKQGFFLGGDDYCYSANAWGIVEHWRRTGIFPDRYTAEAITLRYSGTITPYDYWNAFVYSITDKSPVSMFFLNSFFSCLAAVFIYDLTRRVFNKKAGRIAAFLATFWPSVIFWSVLNLREPLTIFLTALCMWAFVLLTHRIKLRYICVGIPALFALISFRLEVAMVFIIAVMLTLLFILKRRTIVSIALILSFMIFAGIVDYKIFINHFQKYLLRSDYANVGPGEGADLYERMEYLRRVRSEEGRSPIRFIPQEGIKNFGSLLLYAPIIVIISLLSPFPWQAGGALKTLGAIESLIFYFLLIYFFAGLWKIIKGRHIPAYYLVFFIVTMLISLGLLEGNLGSLFRHKSVALIFSFVFIGVGFDYFAQKKTLTRAN